MNWGNPSDDLLVRDLPACRPRESMHWRRGRGARIGDVAGSPRAHSGMEEASGARGSRVWGRRPTETDEERKKEESQVRSTL